MADGLRMHYSKHRLGLDISDPVLLGVGVDYDTVNFVYSKKQNVPTLVMFEDRMEAHAIIVSA